MNNTEIYLVFGCLATLFALIVWSIFRVMMAVPHDQREHLDEPPLMFKLLWFPIRLVGFYVSPFLSHNLKERYTQYISYAGYDYVFRPVNIVAAQFVFAIAFGLVGYFGLSMAQINTWGALIFALYGFFYPVLWLKSQRTTRVRRFLKDLPFYLDIVTLCVEAGLTLNNAFQHAVNKGPAGPVRAEFERAIRDMRSGMTRTEALRLIAKRVDESSVNSLMSSIIQAENMGMSLGPILRQQAEQKRIERFLRAEKMAMEAPVKMLLPLVACIFPCTFVVIGFPIYVLIMDAFK